MEIYRGDTFKYDFTTTLEDETLYEFQPGDILKIGIKDKLSNSKYVLYKEIKIDKSTENVLIFFSPDQMKQCSLGEKLFEVELTDTHGDVYTLLQEKIKIVGDVIHG